MLIKKVINYSDNIIMLCDEESVYVYYHNDGYVFHKDVIRNLEELKEEIVDKLIQSIRRSVGERVCAFSEVVAFIKNKLQNIDVINLLNGELINLGVWAIKNSYDSLFYERTVCVRYVGNEEWEIIIEPKC